MENNNNSKFDDHDLILEADLSGVNFVAVLIYVIQKIHDRRQLITEKWSKQDYSTRKKISQKISNQINKQKDCQKRYWEQHVKRLLEISDKECNTENARNQFMALNQCCFYLSTLQSVNLSIIVKKRFMILYLIEFDASVGKAAIESEALL